MPSLVTLQSLIDSAKDRSDMENSNFISTAQWTKYINSAAKELYDILIAKGLNYNIMNTTLVVDGINDTFYLPSDFYKLMGIDYYVGGLLTPMTRFEFLDRNRFQEYETIVQYQLIGNNNILFRPLPPAQTMVLWYSPVIDTLSNMNDTIDGVHGWEEYIIVRAAMWALQKEESDTTNLKQDLMFLKERIEEMAENRDQGLPARVTDARRVQYFRDPVLGWDTI